MNINKAQKEIFNSILKKERDSTVRVCGFYFDGFNRYAVTGDGYHGFIFKSDQIAFNVAKVQSIGNLLRIDEIFKEENKLTETRLLYSERYPRNLMTEVFRRNDGKKTFINRSFLTCFENASFYQEKENGLVLVEELGEIVGFVLPIRHVEETED